MDKNRRRTDDAGLMTKTLAGIAALVRFQVSIYADRVFLEEKCFWLKCWNLNR